MFKNNKIEKESVFWSSNLKHDQYLALGVWRGA